MQLSLKLIFLNTGGRKKQSLCKPGRREGGGVVVAIQCKVLALKYDGCMLTITLVLNTTMYGKNIVKSEIIQS